MVVTCEVPLNKNYQLYGAVTQWFLEYLPFKQRVTSSNLVSPTTNFGLLAQLVDEQRTVNQCVAGSSPLRVASAVARTGIEADKACGTA